MTGETRSMATKVDTITQTSIVDKASWLPMLIIALAQIQMAFNVSALPISIGDIVDEFETSPSTVGTGLVIYSLGVAGFVMLGSKLGKIIGARRAFQIGVAIHGLSMAWMALSHNVNSMLRAQAVAGLAAALLVPSLVVLIANHYRSRQQSQALGYLGAAQAIAGVLAFIIAGFLGSLLGWRYSFGLIVLIAAVVILLSFRLKDVAGDRDVKIDWVGALLAALAITLISLGFNNITAWGLLLADPNAPYNVLGLSLSPIMIIAGIFFGQSFFSWSHKQVAQNKTPLLALEVLDTPTERAATFSLFIIAMLGSAIAFLMPLNTQIVQGKDSLQTAVIVTPYSLAIFFGTAMVVRLFTRFPPRVIGRLGFIIVAVGLVMLAFSIWNNWQNFMVILSLIVIGLGEGSLLTLFFNVLVSASPKKLAGDVGALRGTTNNLATGLGTAFISVLAVGLLSMIIVTNLEKSPVITDKVIEEQLSLDSIDFVSDEDLDEYLEEELDLTPQQEMEIVNINIDGRIQALKISFLILAGIAVLAIVPVGKLPEYLPGEVPADKL